MAPETVDETLAHATADEPSAYVICEHCGRKFAAITVLHLRNIHGYEGEHPILEYKARFGLRYACSDESRGKISDAKDMFWAERGQHWTEERLLAEIRRRYTTGESLRCKDIPDRLQLAARRLFESWQAAIEKAGISYEETAGEWRWSKEKVIDMIREMAGRGEPLGARYVRAHYPSLYTGGVKHFPSSWRNALVAAGFDPAEHKTPRGHWNNDRAENWVRQRVRDGLSILAQDVPNDLKRFVFDHLGRGWTDFIETLGIAYPGRRKRRDWTRDELLVEIRRWHAAGNPMSFAAVHRSYQALTKYSRRFFGSWDAARAAAGLTIHCGR
jgi:hypothetical protein